MWVRYAFSVIVSRCLFHAVSKRLEKYMLGIEQAFAATTAQKQAAVGIFSVGLLTIVLMTIAIWVLFIVARWKIFTKAGEAGWKSIIPIYADYVQWRIGWKKTGLFWAYLALVIIGYALIIASGAYEVSAGGRMVASGGGNMALAGIGALVMLVGAIISLIAAYKLICAYGHGAGWFVLYILFAPIMLLVLGLGSSQYVGPQD